MRSAEKKAQSLRMSSVGQVCFETESKVSPMYIDLILPLIGEPMAIEEVRDLFQERFLPNNPRFACRAEGSSFIPTEVDLTKHIVELDVPSPQTDEVLMELVSRIGNEALDAQRPLWAAYLLNQGEKQMLVIRMHHCIGDGVSLATATMRMSDSVFARRGEKKSTAASLNPVPYCLKLVMLIRTLFWIMVGLPLVLLKWVRITVFAPKVPALFDRVSPRVGTGKHVAWNTKPIYVHEVKAVADQLPQKATFNDVMLAVISGAIDRYSRYAEKTVFPTDLTLSIPVDIRRTLPKEMGNKIGGFMMRLPVGMSDHEKRCSEIYTRTTASKRLPEQYASYWMFVALSYVPVAIVKPLFKQMSQQVKLVVTNVRGSPKSYFYKGREVQRLIGFIPPPEGVPMGIAVSSLSGQVNVSVKVDRGLIRDPAKFITFIHEELDSMRRDHLAKKEQ